MSDTTPVPAMDLAGYHEVLVVKTGPIEGHDYRRGSRHTVDGPTLQGLRDAGLIDDAQTRPADLASAAGGASEGR